MQCNTRLTHSCAFAQCLLLLLLLQIVWDRESRIDIVFGSSVSGAVKIDDAIAEYERFSNDSDSNDSFSLDSYADNIVPETSSTDDCNGSSSPDSSSSSSNGDTDSNVQHGAETNDWY
jgi:hypothetical protein